MNTVIKGMRAKVTGILFKTEAQGFTVESFCDEEYPLVIGVGVTYKGKRLVSVVQKDCPIHAPDRPYESTKVEHRILSPDELEREVWSMIGAIVCKLVQELEERS